jgi:hypothetical protein
MKTVIVAGITRSGLTLTMQMLHAGGYPCAGTYPAFEDYPLGRIPFGQCTGKAIKVVDTHTQLPPTGEYYVIRTSRDYKELSKSMRKFLNLTTGRSLSREDMRKMEKSLPYDYYQIDSWAKKQKGLLVLDFEEMILQPEDVALKIAEFIQHPLDIQKMVDTVVPRHPDCYPTMLELNFL